MHFSGPARSSPMSDGAGVLQHNTRRRAPVRSYVDMDAGFVVGADEPVPATGGARGDVGSGGARPVASPAEPPAAVVRPVLNAASGAPVDAVGAELALLCASPPPPPPPLSSPPPPPLLPPPSAALHAVIGGDSVPAPSPATADPATKALAEPLAAAAALLPSSGEQEVVANGAAAVFVDMAAAPVDAAAAQVGVYGSLTTVDPFADEAHEHRAGAALERGAKAVRAGAAWGSCFQAAVQPLRTIRGVRWAHFVTDTDVVLAVAPIVDSTIVYGDGVLVGSVCQLPGEGVVEVGVVSARLSSNRQLVLDAITLGGSERVLRAFLPTEVGKAVRLMPVQQLLELERAVAPARAQQARRAAAHRRVALSAATQAAASPWNARLRAHTYAAANEPVADEATARRVRLCVVLCFGCRELLAHYAQGKRKAAQPQLKRRTATRRAPRRTRGAALNTSDEDEPAGDDVAATTARAIDVAQAEPRAVRLAPREMVRAEEPHGTDDAERLQGVQRRTDVLSFALSYLGRASQLPVASQAAAIAELSKVVAQV